MLERTKNSEILEGARLLVISCIRIAEYLKYSIFRGKTLDLTKKVWHELSCQKSTLTVELVFAILEFCSDLNWQLAPMQLVHRKCTVRLMND